MTQSLHFNQIYFYLYTFSENFNPDLEVLTGKMFNEVIGKCLSIGFKLYSAYTFLIIDKHRLITRQTDFFINKSVLKLLDSFAYWIENIYSCRLHYKDLSRRFFYISISRIGIGFNNTKKNFYRSMCPYVKLNRFASLFFVSFSLSISTK